MSWLKRYARVIGPHKNTSSPTFSPGWRAWPIKWRSILRPPCSGTRAGALVAVGDPVRVDSTTHPVRT